MLHTLPGLPGPGAAVRDILVATPPGYATSTARYPVVYLQDGQNLFDPATSYAGEWGLHTVLRKRGRRHPAILVGIPNLGIERLREYSPFDDAVRGAGEGVEYLRWLTTELKPRIDAAFRTLPVRQHTAVAGSSMGGLFALYALLAGASTFGAAWSLSPALWYADAAIFRWLKSQAAPYGQIYLDVGLGEGDDTVFDVRRMRDLLLDRGWTIGGTLRYREDPEGEHNEASWGRRIDEEWPRLIGMISRSR